MTWKGFLYKSIPSAIPILTKALMGIHSKPGNWFRIQCTSFTCLPPSHSPPVERVWVVFPLRRFRQKHGKMARVFGGNQFEYGVPDDTDKDVGGAHSSHSFEWMKPIQCPYLVDIRGEATTSPGDLYNEATTNLMRNPQSSSGINTVTSF